MPGAGHRVGPGLFLKAGRGYDRANARRARKKGFGQGGSQMGKNARYFQLFSGFGAAALLLSACTMGGTGASGGADQAAGPGLGALLSGPGPGGSGGRSREIEAPEVFLAEEAGLWDGRPSLGGIWVASPEAKTPERVRMVNLATGKAVAGALFRRERENPGPRLQLSSEAATALGLLAGQPAKIRVVALRHGAAPSAEGAKPGEAEALGKAATAALAAAPPAPSAGTKPAPNPAAPAVPAAPPAPAAGAGAGAKPGLFGGLFKGQAPAAAPAPSAPQAVPPAPATGGGARAMVGSFAVKANAEGAAQKLQGAGLKAEVKEVRQGEKVLWALIAQGADQVVLLETLKKLGFADAYLLK